MRSTFWEGLINEWYFGLLTAEVDDFVSCVCLLWSSFLLFLKLPLVVHCDNEAWNKACSADVCIAKLILHITFICMLFNFVLKVVHVPCFVPFSLGRIPSSAFPSFGNFCSHFRSIKVLACFISAGHSQSTLSMYKQNTCGYPKFLGFYHMSIEAEPLDLRMFSPFISISWKIVFFCIRTYIYGIRDWALCSGYKDSTRLRGSLLHK